MMYGLCLAAALASAPTQALEIAGAQFPDQVNVATSRCN